MKTLKGPLTDESLAEVRKEMEVRKTTEVFVLFPLGSQFDHLIALMMGKIGVFCLVADPKTFRVADVRKLNPKGLILSGGPASVYAEEIPFDRNIFDLGTPVLGICLGFQLWATHRGAEVKSTDKREYNTHHLTLFHSRSPLFEDVDNLQVLQSHGDNIDIGKAGIKVLASSENCPVAAGWCEHLWGVQFHPEVPDTVEGEKIINNFCFEICGAQDRFPTERIVEQKILDLHRNLRGGKKVLLALSCGVDSSLVAYLLRTAVEGKERRVRAIYIQGIDRAEDRKDVQRFFGNLNWLELKIVDATEEFLLAFQGKREWDEKRLVMRELYPAILEREIKLFQPDFIAQGTLYTDICESGGGYDIGARKATIKRHHNPGLKFSVPELTPLADCVKDGVRSMGEILDMPRELLRRHPFPGPGLAMRIVGEVTAEKLRIARAADSIYIAGLRSWHLYDMVWQAGAVLTDVTHTTTKGDEAGQGRVVVLWAVNSTNGFTAHWSRLPYDFLDWVSQKITNEIPEIGSVEYHISSKPPSTIEFG